MSESDGCCFRSCKGTYVHRSLQIKKLKGRFDRALRRRDPEAAHAALDGLVAMEGLGRGPILAVVNLKAGLYKQCGDYESQYRLLQEYLLDKPTGDLDRNGLLVVAEMRKARDEAEAHLSGLRRTSSDTKLYLGQETQKSLADMSLPMMRSSSDQAVHSRKGFMPQRVNIVVGNWSTDDEDEEEEEEGSM